MKERRIRGVQDAREAGDGHQGGARTERPGEVTA